MTASEIISQGIPIDNFGPDIVEYLIGSVIYTVDRTPYDGEPSTYITQRPATFVDLARV